MYVKKYSIYYLAIYFGSFFFVVVSRLIVVSVLERHQGLHDPVMHVMLRRDHRRDSFLHPLLWI